MSYIPPTNVVLDKNGELEHYSEALIPEKDLDVLWGFDYAVGSAVNEFNDTEFEADINNCSIAVAPTSDDIKEFLRSLEITRNDLIVGLIDGDEHHDELYEKRKKELEEIGIDKFTEKYIHKPYLEQFKCYLGNEE